MKLRCKFLLNKTVKSNTRENDTMDVIPAKKRKNFLEIVNLLDNKKLDLGGN